MSTVGTVGSYEAKTHLPALLERVQAGERINVTALPVEIDSETSARALDYVLALARAFSLTAYDATYLDLAMREGLVLAALDLELRKAARKAGVRIFS